MSSNHPNNKGKGKANVADAKIETNLGIKKKWGMNENLMQCYSIAWAK